MNTSAGMHGVTRLNDLPRDEFIKVLPELCHLPVEDWAIDVVGQRPFSDFEDLIEKALSSVTALSDVNVVAAHVGLRRLGSRHDGFTGRRLRWAKQESARMDRDDEALQALNQAQDAYEAKFGHVFLISATGLTNDEMLAALHARLTNSPEAECDAVREELRKLVAIRLTRLVEELDDPEAALTEA
ncbi:MULTISPECIES: 2-oxo-4-hydroxy-4-carboxy-5-ureidoimidazoline decarboxylase [Arthrobacter]|uniref:2-oxo-4-hydroxy-4-carboxy-5-ureidoimidazoline decarboxylase n=1 Tax=Arthrobacter terricola TaxID=2547396 RepID=A0A4R5KDJ0_9MICC|nr:MULTISPECIES: 2-oxo-4-hydroxy-4-carboxy-5-ureidoimidazoline decarboxylase [Arthrobacter]MBT8162322.1 2-oxo-4-hydroxy-4-carboxy-5-ureidoimidazoline decarboxylase [Arthrobacter sp. GN70]TDF93419.1 2-oxo-4-hydroxy-4-carboxy-5-ureidoimidazoline decarboxylase [Arthrobacter terricola]